jgi:hypothetical protein
MNKNCCSYFTTIRTIGSYISPTSNTLEESSLGSSTDV